MNVDVEFSVYTYEPLIFEAVDMEIDEKIPICICKPSRFKTENIVFDRISVYYPDINETGSIGYARIGNKGSDEYKMHFDLKIISKRTICEIDGKDHFNGSKTIENDIRKQKMALSLGWIIIRVNQEYVLKNDMHFNGKRKNRNITKFGDRYWLDIVISYMETITLSTPPHVKYLFESKNQSYENHKTGMLYNFV